MTAITQTLRNGLSIPASRRQFIKVSTSAVGGLSLGVGLNGCGVFRTQSTDSNGNWQASAWLEIQPDNTIVFTLDRVEMGQGTYTGITTLLAEELRVDPEVIVVEFAGAAQVYRNPDYGLQLTGGSNSLSTSWGQIRETGAAARELLLAAASDVFQVPPVYLKVENGGVHHPASSKTLSFGSLTRLAAKQEIPDPLPLTPEEEFKYIGKRNKRLDSRLKVTGTAAYGIDAKLEGMRYAVVSRSPYVGDNMENRETIERFNRSEIESMPGVESVHEIHSGVAIVASRYWQARKAQEKLDISWSRPDSTPSDVEAVFSLYQQAAEDDEGDSKRSEGDIDEAIEQASKVIEVEYRAPFLAHATMEPMNCLAHVHDGKAEIWTGTQAPDIAQVAVARVTDVSLDDVVIHNQFLGGGFGRRLSQDFIAEAAEISYRAKVPVKLVWSREEDTRNDFYRPASLHKMRGCFDERGELSGWDHQIICPKIMDWYVWNAAPAMFPWAPEFMYTALGYSGLMTEGTPMTPEDRSPIEGAQELPYDIPAIEVRHTKADAGVPISYWRSVGHSHNGFVTESFLDELAQEAGQDVYEFKRARLNSAPRLQKVLDTAAKEGQWGRKTEPGVYQGIAAHKSFGSYVAELVELKIEDGNIRVLKVVCAVDCGFVVNPDIVTMQMESGIIFGITAALYGDITIEDGQIKQSNFHDYTMLRMDQSPVIETIIVDSNESPTGVGEPGLPPLAPAMAGALFAATGKRFRSLPFKLA